MKVIITGGAGFIGTNLAASLAKDGHEIVIFDNLSRKGTQKNADWLTSNNKNINLQKGDLRTDQAMLDQLVSDADAVYHLGGQVAVTTSVANPR